MSACCLIFPSIANAAPTPASTTDNKPVTQGPNSAVSPEKLEILHQKLSKSNTPRTKEDQGGTTYEVFHFDKDGKKFSMAFPVASDRVSGGFDHYRPYIDLDGAEQGAGAAGVTGTIGTVICAVLGPETGGAGCAAAAGIAATVVGIASAHGVCPHEQKMRVYFASNNAICLP